MTKPDPVPALARTDVRPAAPPETPPDSRRQRVGRALAIGVAVLAAVALLVLGLLFALGQDLVNSALLSTDLLDAWR